MDLYEIQFKLNSDFHTAAQSDRNNFRNTTLMPGASLLQYPKQILTTIDDFDEL